MDILKPCDNTIVCQNKKNVFERTSSSYEWDYKINCFLLLFTSTISCNNRIDCKDYKHTRFCVQSK